MFGIKGKSDLDRIFTDFFGSTSKIRVNLSENEKEFIVTAELPGVLKENIIVEYKTDTVNICIKEYETKNEQYIKKEREGFQERSIFIPNIDYKKAKAYYNQGLLTVNLPKKDIVDCSFLIPIE